MNKYPIFRNLKKCILYLVLGFAFLGIIDEVSYAKEDGEVLVRPRASRPKLKAELKEIMFDGMPFIKLLIRNKAFGIEMPPMVGWVETSSKSSESYAMRRQHSPDERVSFSFYRKNEFLSDYKPESLKAYIELMKREYRKKGGFVVLDEDQNFVVRNTAFIMGQSYRLIDYIVEYRSQGKVLNKQRVRDFILFPTEDYLLILRHEGDEGWVEKSVRSKTLHDSLRQSEFISKRSN